MGKPLEPDAVAEQLQSIYGTETFGLVSYDVVHEDGRTGVVVHARPTTYGPNFLQAGLLLPAQDEALSVRATRSALAKLDVDASRLLN